MSKRDEYRALGAYGTLGLEIALSIAFGFFGGRWLDGKLHTDPWLSIVGFFFGCGAAVKAIVRVWKDMQRVAAKEEREQGNPAPLFPSHAEEAEERAKMEREAEARKAEEREKDCSTRGEPAPMPSGGERSAPAEDTDDHA